VTKYGVHQTLINAWKKQAMEGMAGVFSDRAEAAETAREEEVEKLHPRSASWWWNVIFCGGPPVDERGPEARDD